MILNENLYLCISTMKTPNIKERKWKVPILLLALNAVFFIALAPFFSIKKSEESYLHSSGQEKYIDKTSDIINWGYALFKLFKDNAKPNQQ